MRGRPTCLLLWRCAPFATAAILLGPPAALAAPSPDRAPNASSGIAPDPAPGSRPDTRPAAPKQPASRATPQSTATRPAYVAPVAPAATTKAHAAPRHAHEQHKQAKHVTTHPRAAAHPTAFRLPRVAVPVLGTAAASVGRSHDEEVVLAVVALLLAAVAAGSGARLVSAWNRAGTA